MRKALTMLLVLVVVQAATGTAGAQPYRFHWQCAKTLKPAAELACGKRDLKHATDVLRFLESNPVVGTGLSRLRVRLDHAWLRTYATRTIADATKRIYLSSFPPHHQLWLCIHSGEGAWNANTGNGYYGGMQMHADWGYGTSHHASDDSQLAQEWAAERSLIAAGAGWKRWLWGQWAADARCFA